MTVKLVVLIISVALIANSICDNDNIVERIKSRYNNTTEKCIDSNQKEKPAYQCSGLIIRGVNKNLQLEFAWSMKPLHKRKKAFSLSYLRQDQAFSSFPKNYDSGFIVYPHLETPPGKNTYKVYCSFPINADSDDREGHGCGKSKGDTSRTGDHCSKQGINSFDDWKSYFKNIMRSQDKNYVKRQCAFDMTTQSAATDFAISMNANKYLRSKMYAYRNNELRMHAWNEMNAKAIPIEAFFYLIGSARGKLLAEKYQNDFYWETGNEIVPILGIQLPTERKSFNVILHEQPKIPA